MQRELPEGWEWKRLGDICKTTSGGTPARNNESYFDGKIPWLKSGELENNVIYSTEEAISQSGLENSSTKIIPKGTPLIALYGATVGKVGILGIDSAINQAICAVFPPDEIDPKFLFYFLKTSRPALLKLRAGGAQPNISQDIVRNIQIPLPPLQVQRQIVAVLEEAEAVKRQRHEADALTRALLQSVFSEMFGDPVTNEKGWGAAKLSDEIEIQHGFAFKSEFFSEVDNGIILLVPGNFHRDGGLYFNHRITKFYTGPFATKDVLKNGDLLVLMTDLSPKMHLLGKVVILQSDHKILHNQRIGKIAILNHNRLNPIFLTFVMNNEKIRDQIKSTATGSLVKHTSPRKIMDVSIPLPPLALQQQFANIVEIVERIRDQQLASGRQIEGLCEGLMQRAFAGELAI